ncbi:MAG TPA: ATP-binding protein [Verrucomicrobiae bacterium]|nr:ATP-binding protein [Verrucomicrobiae bacterium]
MPDATQPDAPGHRRPQSVPVVRAPAAPGNWLLAHPAQQYALVFFSFVAASLLNLSLVDLIGYQAVALIYLLAVVVLALFLSRGPVIVGTALNALGWCYAFAPPRYSFHISSFYDKMMVVTYFAVALTISQLTTRLRAHREAVARTKLVAESERLGRTLLNSVSHELRTPIAAITSAAGELRASNALTPLQKKLTTEIETASTRLNRVVQSLLSAARLNSGQLRPKLDWCDIPELVRLALRDVGDLAAAHPLEVRIAPGLHLAKMDFVLMEQALANLVANAAMHTPPGTAIDIMARVEQHELMLQVADRGPGLPADQMERIFDSFHRVSGATPGGIGLGLAIVRGFVEAQGGRVSAVNRQGGGALFTIFMPARESPDIPEEHT